MEAFAVFSLEFWSTESSLSSSPGTVWHRSNNVFMGIYGYVALESNSDGPR